MHKQNLDKMFQHYKGGYYEKQGEALYSETHEKMVIYKGVCEDYRDEKTWVRPLSMWLDEVGVDGKPVPRFRPCDESDLGEVVYFTARCPECDQVQPAGKHATQEAAFAAMKAQGYCHNCDEEVGEDDRPRSWTSKTEFAVIKPLVHRHIEDVQAALPSSEIQEGQ